MVELVVNEEEKRVSDAENELLREQMAYYRARASEYDEWFLRQGRYDHGPEANARWFAEVDVVAAALDRFAPTGDVLELAAGTGIWTQRLRRTAAHLTAVDASPETLAINRERLSAGSAQGSSTGSVEYVVADLFSWQPQQAYDSVFFGFWLSHVPPNRFRAFWSMVQSALKPGGRVFFVDSRYHPEGTAHDHTLGAADDTTLSRRLNDGRTYRIVKVFHQPAALTSQLAALGWTAAISLTPTYFLYGSAHLSRK